MVCDHRSLLFVLATTNGQQFYELDDGANDLTFLASLPGVAMDRFSFDFVGFYKDEKVEKKKKRRKRRSRSPIDLGMDAFGSKVLE